jgi:hypothetical protein
MPNKRSHLKSAERTMESHKRRKHKTQDLNPSPVTRNKACKKMGEKLGRTSHLKVASLIATTARYKIVAA